MDKYDEVTLQIVDVIKENFFDNSDSNYKFNEEIQKKITDVLKNNFNIKNEDIGMSLMKDVNMFNPESGYEFDAPLFAAPMLLPIGAMIISPETFPNYGADNKYIGYTDKGRFYRINDFTKFMRHMRKQPLTVVALFIMIYLIVSVLAYSVKIDIFK